jgi:predicted regulator of Ras-like GTPase activity (Roadblock/LC7/MglB family)
MFNTDGVLKNLNDVPGVHQSLIVGRDGFVINSMGDMEADSVGAVISTAIGAIEAMGRDCKQGNLFEVMAEYKGGVVIAAPIGQDAVLGIVADDSANLGGVRFVVKKSMKELEKVM